MFLLLATLVHASAADVAIVPYCTERWVFPRDSARAAAAILPVWNGDRSTPGIVVGADGSVLTTARDLRPGDLLEVELPSGDRVRLEPQHVDPRRGFALLRTRQPGLTCLAVTAQMPPPAAPLYDLGGLGGPLVDERGRLIGFTLSGSTEELVAGYTGVLPMAWIAAGLGVRWDEAPDGPAPVRATGRFISAAPMAGGPVTTDAGYGLVRIEATDPARAQGFRPYALGAIEVTQDLWVAVMDNNPSRYRSLVRPVEQIDFASALRFCNELSRREGLTPAYTVEGEEVTWDPAADGYRLPTESEWRFAARAGTDATYAGGNEPAAVAWYWDTAGRGPRPPGQKAGNAWGLSDLSGNVAEWVWTGPYRQPLREGTGMVLGGSWRSSMIDLRIDRGGIRDKSLVKDTIGLRVARWLPLAQAP